MDNMNCSLETGICGSSTDHAMDIIDFNQNDNKVTLYYFTDPICSHCWALEPVLNRFIEQYGHYFKLSIVMGGLLPSWSGFADRANGIRKPADVAAHWREVGDHSRMPIDGTLWLDNPIQSSYPVSRVFKVIQSQNEAYSSSFLRQAREAVFAFNKNVGDEQVLEDIVNRIGYDGNDIVEQAGTEHAQKLLEMDFDLTRNFGVTGFPTVTFVNEANQGIKVVGAQSLETYVGALSKVRNEAPAPIRTPTLHDWLKKGHLHLFSKEIEIMYDLSKESVHSFIQESLPDNYYRIQHILGEAYLERT
ncbi:DsbA family protein [Paenibacillus oenotherae]|uniref:DsbA family protein n=1 Tax=Paenibacillus oenotherae TaxID=1435645 RepID=A0ABS7D6Z3_9BACL|nr:DsbA family protein [Paenibacillus oenotherae]MBW7475296.1 DsbA family protein [Paenibacillus oenotherae]